ncbi:MAG: hypothetical protein SCALA702_31270 [Melioribacteraceae bacterium]|nr:MAG: hypothetical protein SCALA702_31270 [Melioribacteraceae bacterium]
MGIFDSYFSWLQKDNPTGDVEKYPEIDEHGQTSKKGIYIAGDLTGIPLLKFAAENGKSTIEHIINNDLPMKDLNPNVYQIAILGAGPAGIAAGIEAEKAGISYIIIESSKVFNTIQNFPKGKPIFAEPKNYKQHSELKIDDGTKESLLEQLYKIKSYHQLNIKEECKISKITEKAGLFELECANQNFQAQRVLIAIGKSGDSRRLNVPGEDMDKVYNRMFDPADTSGKNVLVVGGGDSALETAIAASNFAKSVTLIYRGNSFARPKEGNLEKFNSLVKEGKIQLHLNTNIQEIKTDKVILNTEAGSEENENDIVFSMIGRELPVSFFRKSDIKMDGDFDLIIKLQFLLLILISGVIYFGKSSASFYKEITGTTSDTILDIAGKLFQPEVLLKLLSLPYILLETLFSDKIRIWSVTKYINAVVAYISFVGAGIIGAYLLYKFVRKNVKNIRYDWNTLKYSYFIFVGLFFVIVFFGGRYFGYEFLGKSQGFWYTGLYSLTILIFGLRRIYVKPTKYIKYQTTALILIQALPLFILPEFVFPWLGNIGALGSDAGFIMTQVFPKESYWRSYGFILAWPLNFSNLYNSNITTFWLVFSLVQTFVFIPLIVYKWGKGAYCGWICSCGAMAETLGDEYRTKAPHGHKAKKWENIGQWILLFAFIITAVKLLSILYNVEIPIINEKISYVTDVFHKIYYISIDVIFAGVLGVGVYFFLSGRVWCRFGCPLAALMHIYNRFTKYRIFAEKKKCISCNICTKVCHMGIDVMNYANKGIPMNDVECVRCSACVVNCPTEVLYFGEQEKSDPDNILFKTEGIPPKKDNNWVNGLPYKNTLE